MWLWIVLLALSAVAFALRVRGLHQDLFADELFTFDDVYGRGVAGVVERVRDGYEDSPPLFFLLAWATAKLGDPTIWIRVPSVVLGTALVPLVYVLGTRTLGRAAGIAAAGIVAVSPFTVFYGGEARAYASLMFFSALSTVALLRALETRSGRWWLAYAACVCAIFYTHYTGVFVVLTQAAWALWFFPESRRRVVLANLVAVVFYGPWLVTELTNAPTYTRIPALSPRYLLTTLAETVPGHPLERPQELPGSGLLALFLTTLGVAAALLAWRTLRSRPKPATMSPELVLLVLLGVATPCGMVAFSLGEHNILFARGLSASVPAAVILIGFVLARPPPALAVVLTGIAVGVLLVGTSRSLRDPPRDTGFREVAQYIDSHREAHDAVAYVSLYYDPPHPLAGFLTAYLKGERMPVRELNVNDEATWRFAAHGGRVFLVLQPIVVFGRPLRLEEHAGPANCFALESKRVISRSPPLLLGIYGVPKRHRPCFS